MGLVVGVMEKADSIPSSFLLLELAHRARRAAFAPELEFLLVNDTRLLLPYRQSVLWRSGTGVVALSGVVQADRNAPYVQWISQVCAQLAQGNEMAQGAREVADQDVTAAVAADWKEWLPAHAVWVPLAIDDESASASAGLLLCMAQAPASDRLPLLTEWGDVWSHAWRALQRPSWTPARWLRKDRSLGRAWWRRPSLWSLVFLLAIAFVPVRLTVLAPGELVPAEPAVLRAPLDGVVDLVHVQPNEIVKQGQLLYSLDEAQIASRLEVSEQALLTAEAEYRQFAQMALGDARSKTQLAVLAGRIGERRAEQAFLAEQRKRTRVVAPRDGMVLFDAPSEWIGRPVQTGERVMRIAQPNLMEIEAWVSIGDAVPLPVGTTVRLYLAANPFASLEGKLRYVAYEAVPRPEGTHAYRVRAAVEDVHGARIGQKGTAKLEGDTVPLVYWVLRKPWAVIRQWVAL